MYVYVHVCTWGVCVLCLHFYLKRVKRDPVGSVKQNLFGMTLLLSRASTRTCT